MKFQTGEKCSRCNRLATQAVPWSQWEDEPVCDECLTEEDEIELWERWASEQRALGLMTFAELAEFGTRLEDERERLSHE